MKIAPPVKFRLYRVNGFQAWQFVRCVAVEQFRNGVALTHTEVTAGRHIGLDLFCPHAGIGHPFKGCRLWRAALQANLHPIGRPAIFTYPLFDAGHIAPRVWLWETQAKSKSEEGK